MQHAFFGRTTTDNLKGHREGLQEERQEKGLQEEGFQETARRTPQETPQETARKTPQETPQETLGIARAVSVKQTHSARAFVVRQTSDLWDDTQPSPEADALVSCVPNLLLCVYTADCAPVLLFEPEARVCAAVHAGWRGALGGIVQKTLSSMRELGALEKRMLAVVGPTISVASYPVGEEFPKPFLEQDAANSNFFVRKFVRKSEQWHFDLPAYVRGCLRSCGVERVRSLADVSGRGIDTFSDRRFFSHRRASREGEQERGRNLACIALED